MTSWRPTPALALLLLALAGAARAQAPVRSEAPIRQSVLTNGALRYSVPIQIGSVRIEAGLDSGATGLRVVPGVLGANDVKPSEKSTMIGFGSGTRLEGLIGEANLSIGGLSQLVTLQLITKVGCLEIDPGCAAGKLDLKTYRPMGGGLPGQGFPAMLGINMGEDEISRPLRAIGAKRWIVELPLPGATSPGRLILNPTAEELKDFRMFRTESLFLHDPGGLHDAIPGCLANAATGQKVCAPALFDTGAMGVSVMNWAGGAPWPASVPLTLTIGDGSSTLSASFTADPADRVTRLGYGRVPNPPVTHLQPGVLPYFAWSVLYDSGANRIGLKPRADTPYQLNPAR